MAYDPPAVPNTEVDSPVDITLEDQYRNSLDELIISEPTAFWNGYYAFGVATNYFLDAQVINLASPGLFTLADQMFIYKPEGVTSFDVNIYAQANQVTSAIHITLAGFVGAATFTALPVGFAWQTLTVMTPVALPAAAGFYEIECIADSVLFATTFDLRGLVVIPRTFNKISSDETKNNSPCNTDLNTKYRDYANVIIGSIPICRVGGTYYRGAIAYPYVLDAAVNVGAGVTTDMVKDVQIYIPEGLSSVLCLVRGACAINDANHHIDLTIGGQTISWNTWAVYPAFSNQSGVLSGLSPGWQSLSVWGRTDGGAAGAWYNCRGIIVVPSP